MSSHLRARPFEAYDGDDPFIFVSYAHLDFELVYPELDRIRKLGFNIWYDQGIEVGKNWTDQLAQRLSDCALVIFFITPNSALSRHCGNEVHFALDLEKPLLNIYLRPATLSPGQRMQLGAIQGIVKHELGDTEYADKLQATLQRLMSSRSAAEQTSDARAVRAGPSLPMGLVTLLDLDIFARHELETQLGDRFAELILRLRSRVRDVIARHSGYQIDMHGDNCFAAFISAHDGMLAAIDIQQAVRQEEWPCGLRVKVRIGLHTGQPSLADNQYFGEDVSRVRLIVAAANPGQILLSSAARAQMPAIQLPEGTELRDLGSHRLRGLPYPEVLYDLSVPGLDRSFGPIATLTNRPTNLPRALSSFVGRSVALTRIADILKREETRILTLTGPGGTGKTRLAIEAARMAEQNFIDGVFLVELDAVTDPERMIPAIAEALGIKELLGKTLYESLVYRLSDARMLLVLDNFEQIVEGASQLPKLLHESPGLKLLVSSRESLRLQLEREYAVEPMQLPVPDDAQDIDRMGRIESVQLFLERVREFKADFALTPENARAVASICVRLDGLPLAVELAAARLKFLSPQALLQDLERSLDVLKSKSRDLPERQRTLYSTVEWSYKLLDPVERELFGCLSVFRSGFSLSAAQLVTAVVHHAGFLADSIESLVSKSLLKTDPDQIEPRFWMLETIREFGARALEESGETYRISENHARYYVELAESQAPGLIGRQQRQCVTRLLADNNNLRRALDWSLEQGRADFIARMFHALKWMWLTQGHFTETRERVAKALERFGSAEDSREKALIHETAAWVDVLSGDYAASAPNLEICHGIYMTFGDEADLGRTRLLLGLARMATGAAGGLDMCVQAVEAFRRIGDDYYLALSNITVGICHLFQGEAQEAEKYWQQALEILRRIGNSYWPGQILQNLGHFRLQANDWPGAFKLFMESLELAREFDYPIVSNLAVAGMGGVAVLRGRHADAARLFGAVEHAMAKLGIKFEPLDQAQMDNYLAMVTEALPEADFKAAIYEGANWSEQQIRAAAQAVERD